MHLDAMKRAVMTLESTLTYEGGNTVTCHIDIEPEKLFDLGFQFGIEMGLLQENSSYEGENTSVLEDIRSDTSDRDIDILVEENKVD